MAKFDTSKVENWEKLTDAEKLKALLEADIPDKVDLTQYVTKAIADKYASEAADWKKKFNSKLSEEEQKKIEDETARKEMEEKYNELLKKSSIADFTAKYLALGYAQDAAEKMAAAQFEGDSAKMFEIMTAQSKAMEESIKKKLMEDTPKPDGRGGKPDAEKTPDIVLAEKLAEESKAAGKTALDAQKNYFG